MSDKIHSTGRGGAGNIGADATTYVDGDIVREGTPYEGGEYRGGRGGAGNTVVSSKPNPDKQPLGVSSPVPAKSEDVIPEPAMRTAEGHENFHTGRGGQGNINRSEFGGHSSAGEAAAAQKSAHHGESLLDKAKHAIGLDKKEKPASG